MPVHWIQRDPAVERRTNEGSLRVSERGQVQRKTGDAGSGLGGFSGGVHKAPRYALRPAALVDCCSRILQDPDIRRAII